MHPIDEINIELMRFRNPMKKILLMLFQYKSESKFKT
jgi:hypothetical protein